MSVVPTVPLVVLELFETISATCVDATNYQAFVDAVAHHLNLNYVYIKTNLPHMGNNSFSLTVPATIGKLTDLVSLQLAHVAKLPDAIGSLPLRNLQIQQQSLTVLPDAFSELRFLVTLNLKHNSYRGQLKSVPSMRRMTNLRSFDIGGNKLTSFPDGLIGKGMTNLATLELASNRITGAVPADLDQLTSLSILRLQNNLITSFYSERWRPLKSLTAVSLHNNSLEQVSLALMPADRPACVELRGNKIRGSAAADMLASVAPNVSIFLHGTPLCSESQVTLRSDIAVQGHCCALPAWLVNSTEPFDNDDPHKVDTCDKFPEEAFAHKGWRGCQNLSARGFRY